MKIFKVMFFNMIILGTMVTATAYSWMIMWMGLEINLMCLIPILSSKTPKISEAALKYFLVQAVASLILLISIMMMLNCSKINEKLTEIQYLLMNMSMLMKMGAAPFHFWFPEVMMGLSWMNCLLISTWQKIAPMTVLMNIFINKILIFSSIIMSSLVSLIFIMNQTMLKKIMAYSSINHLAWMLISMFLSFKLWIFYLTIYSITNLALILYFFKNSITMMNQLFTMKSTLEKMFLSFKLLSLAGLPPTIGFLPKWFVIQEMISCNMTFLALILILSSIMTLIIYFTILYPSMTLNSMNTKFIKKTIINYFLFMISMSGLFLVTLMFNLI